MYKQFSARLVDRPALSVDLNVWPGSTRRHTPHIVVLLLFFSIASATLARWTLPGIDAGSPVAPRWVRLHGAETLKVLLHFLQVTIFSMIALQIPAAEKIVLPASAGSVALTAFPTGAFWSGAGFVYVQRAPAELSPVQRCHGPVGVFRPRHLHEGEPVRMTGRVSCDIAAIYWTVCCKQLV
jgi:hypothetical protein